MSVGEARGREPGPLLPLPRLPLDRWLRTLHASPLRLSPAVQAFIPMVGLTLVDGVFLSNLLTHRFSTSSAAISTGLAIFSGAGALSAGRKLPGSLALQMFTVALVYAAVGILALLCVLLLPFLPTLMLGGGDLHAMTAVLLVQLSLVIAGWVPPAVDQQPSRERSFRYLLRLLRHYQLTAALLFLLLGLRLAVACGTVATPFLRAALFSPADGIIIGALLAVEIAISRIPCLRSHVPPFAVAWDGGESTARYVLRLVLDYRVTLALLAVIWATHALALLCRALPHLLHHAHVVMVGQVTGVLLALAAAWVFTSLGIAALRLSTDWYHEGLFKLAGAGSLWCIAGTQLGFALPDRAPLYVLACGLAAGLVYRMASFVATHARFFGLHPPS